MVLSASSAWVSEESSGRVVCRRLISVLVSGGVAGLGMVLVRFGVVSFDRGEGVVVMLSGEVLVIGVVLGVGSV